MCVNMQVCVRLGICYEMKTECLLCLFVACSVLIMIMKRRNR